MPGKEGTLAIVDYELCGLSKSITRRLMCFALQYSAYLGIDQDFFHPVSSFKVLLTAASCIKQNHFIAMKSMGIGTKE